MSDGNEGTPDVGIDTNTTCPDNVFDELDAATSEQEIENAIKCLKRDKSPGVDQMLNEYLIEFKGFFLPILHSLFNCIFQSGIFPDAWSVAIIIPVFKKGDVQVDNFCLQYYLYKPVIDRYKKVICKVYRISAHNIMIWRLVDLIIPLETSVFVLSVVTMKLRTSSTSF